MRKRSYFVIFMTLVLSTAVLFSCASDGISENTTTGGDSDATAVNTAATSDSTSLVAEIPDVKYDGYEFKILGGKIASTSYAVQEEIFAEEQNGEPLNDALYDRNKMVEDKLGVTIVKVESDNVASDMSKSVMAADEAYDAALDTIMSHVSGINGGVVTDLTELPYIDIDKPWWNKNAIDTASIANKSYLLFGDLNYSDKNSTWALVFNKRLYEENGLEEPYEMVRNGEWTLDKLEEQCRDITQDLNGDTVLDHNDQWGLLSSDSAVIGFITSCGIKTIETDSAGEFVFSLDSERNVDALSSLYSFFSNGQIQLRAQAMDGLVPDIWTEIINIFKEGRALYRITTLSDVSTMRDMEDDFGILPLPKLDEEQDSYYSTYQAWSGRCYVVPKGASDLERTSAILEYMCSVSTDTLIDAYYDVTLQRKVSRDDESAQMLDIIFDSYTSDIGLTYEIGGMRDMIQNMMKASSDTVVSTLASKKESIISAAEKLYDAVK